MAVAGWQASWIGVAEKAPARKASKIEIKKALYGVSGDPARQIDLTKQFQRAVESGNFTVSADNTTAGRDPAQGVEKTLEVEYSVDGKSIKQSVAEKMQLNLVTGSQEPSKMLPAAEKAVNQWSCYRKVVHLDKAPGKAEARIAVDSKYWLWINGELVVFEGQLKRGPTPQDTYFDRVDLTQHLQKGDNTVALLVWYFGKDGFSHKSSGKPGLVFDAEVDGKPLLSDGSWKAMVHPAFENTGEPHPNMRLPESNVRFDALDPRSNGLAKKGILELANWQRKDHTIFSPVPAGNWNRELPMQMLNSVGYYGFWTYYMYTGNLETIREVYPAVKRYLSIWKLGDDGLVVSREGGWTWGDLHGGDGALRQVLRAAWYLVSNRGNPRRVTIT